MEWVRNSNIGYEAYAYIQKKPISFQVTLDGRYLGWISNYDPHTRSSRPELYISGKCSTDKEAMTYINGLVDKLNNPVEVKETEKTEEDTYVEALSKSLENYTETTEEEILDARADEVITEEAPVEEIIDEEPIKENEEDISEEDTSLEEDIAIFLEKGNKIGMNHLSKGVLKYTTNGKEVNYSSKIYKEPFSAEGISIVKAKVYDDDKNVISKREYILSTN